MPRGQHWVAPALVGLCLFLGGSVQIPWHVAVLQMAALVVLGWSLLSASTEETDKTSTVPLLMAMAFAALVLIQILPLPAAVWTVLPGRKFVVDGLEALNVIKGAMPISLAPASTLSAGLALLVPVAVFAAMVRKRAFSHSLLIASFGLAVLAGTLLGIAQLATGQYYLYPTSNVGTASGFFANGNHMGLLLLMTLPLVVGLAVDRWQRQKRGAAKWMPIAMVAGAAGVLAVAMLINGSLAVLGLAPMVILACALLPSWESRPGLKRAIRGGLAIVVVVTAGVAVWAPSDLIPGETSSFITRGEIWAKTAHAAADAFPVGTGLGTFEQIYSRYEDPAAVDMFYANHAHNDYLELALETGLPGIILIGLFLAWWGRTGWRLWSRPGHSAVARGAVIATGAALAHSIVDFPLRTPALAAAFAAACAIMVVVETARGDKTDLRKSRHVSVR